MIEEIDTNSNFANKEIPDGKHGFRVTDIRKAKSLYVVELTYDDGQEGEQTFFANTIGPLLKVLGCQETEKGKYMLNTEELKGKPFSAIVYHEGDKTDKTKIYQRMKDFDEVPF
jgi:hypothetical protein